MSTKKKILIAVTSHSRLGETGRKTGYYLPEVSHPALLLQRHGFEFDIVSPAGGLAPMDESSRDLDDSANREFLANPSFRAKLENTLAAKDADPRQYAAILFAGGHGTMWDFPSNKSLSELGTRIYESGGVVAAVCHGPAALLGIRLSNGIPLVKDRSVTAFSDAEEDASGLTKVMPFLLETALKKLGAKYSSAPLWKEHVVADGRLVTGQNPASAAGVADAIARILKR